MSIKVAIDHRTEYRFDRPVSLSPHVVRLRPAPHCRIPIHSYSLKIAPQEHFVNWQQDPFGNYLARLVFPHKCRQLSVQVDLVAEIIAINPFDFFVEDDARDFPFEYDRQLASELAPYLEVKEEGPRLRGWIAGIDREPRTAVDFLVHLNRSLHQDIGYVIRMEPGVQSCEQTLEQGRGSCRDSAWLLVQILRHLGLAARFVSGYLVQLTSDVKSLDGPSGPTRDFTDLHAWAEIYLPGAGWIGLDPTSGLFAGEGHIPLACTPDPVSAVPVTGLLDPCETQLYFHNRLRRILEDPRVTKPYTEEQWTAIQDLGHQVDAELLANDVRLTMRGEPTFVSIDDREGEEWNVAALGPTKKRLAEDLLLRLKGRFAPGGLLHRGQGKWYPGEPLPRWALSCFWRRDGEPIWRDASLLGREEGGNDHGSAEAESFCRELAGRLGVDPDHAEPAYEDASYYLWREARLPANVDPLDNRLEDPVERKRLARIFDQGLDRIVGYVLPLRWWGPGEEGGWTSGKWTFREGRLFLLPGDSPMGLRLPLDALPHVPEEASPELIRTGVCLEAREGRLYCFLPPLTHLEHWLDLIQCIEETAAALAMPVITEGYEPPRDSRLLKLAVTPDPGVIEVSIHPAESWDQMVSDTLSLYEEARLARLGTEKFMLDGRHTGTGGGNHVTLGGPTPADSPLLRKPDLLRSLIGYWQHHPSLSYLFSGPFIGPTSQAPRIDEARDDRLYELEIAFQQIPVGEVPQPWLVDRVLRNLLTDVTGNTHRTEFCIDKLYSPDSASGRQGLVEFRAFEMPPHARMSLTQMLLLRTLLARFWKEPHRGQPVRWGTELHDRFLLPHFVWQDFEDVVCDLQRAGYPLQAAWFEPFFEFRFPRYGDLVTDDGIRLELRAGIEPWHLLGEEVTAQGTARLVDGSVERMQVKVSGLVGGRHLLVCNGRQVPLRPTGRSGERVAGVRFKAWSPPSALHPTIPAHQELVFEVIDTWNRVSLGGCTYAVVHPGGRHYETFPVNAEEAESRRIARFRAMGHSGGLVEVPPEEPAGDHPYTLDLRYRPGC